MGVAVGMDWYLVGRVVVEETNLLGRVALRGLEGMMAVAEPVAVQVANVATGTVVVT